MRGPARAVLPALFLVAFAVPVSAATLLFDLGNTARQTAGNWNNIVPATSLIAALVDSQGNLYGSASLEITDTFFQTGEPSQLGTESPTGDAAGFPVDATDDYFFGHTTAFAGADPNPLGQLTLHDLDPDRQYSFTFFASRTGVTDTRDARYTVTGSESGSVVLNASNNNSEVVRVMNIAPDGDDKIVIDVEPGPHNDNANGFFYLGLFAVSDNDSELICFPVGEGSAKSVICL